MTRFPYLDAARIWAASAVYLFHAEIPGFSWGYIGVDFFMVLSGFLVTTSVINAGGASLPRFLQARMSRLVPGMIIFLALAAATLLWLGTEYDRRSMLEYVMPSALYYSNFYSIFSSDSYFNQNNINIYIHLWSLSAEEQFYAAFAIVLLLPARLHVGFKLSAFGLLVAWLVGQSTSFSPDRFYFGTDSRAAQFLVGSLLANFVPRILTLLRALPETVMATMAVLVAALAIWLSLDHQRYFYGGYIAVTAASALFVVASIRGSLSERQGIQIVSQLGHASYTQYLLHMPLLFILSRVTDYGLAWKLAGLPILLLISWTVSNLLERPAQKRLRQLPTALVLIALPAALLVTALISRHTIESSLPQRDADLRTGYFFCDDLTKPCLRAGAPGAPTILLIGDSIGSSVLDGALSIFAEGRSDLAYATAAMPNCAIRSRLTWDPRTGQSHFKHKLCLDKLADSIATALETYNLKRVIIASQSDNLSLLSSTGDGLTSKDPKWTAEAIEGTEALLVPFRRAGIPISFVLTPSSVPKIECLGHGPCEGKRTKRTVQAVYEAVANQGDTIIELDELFCSADTCPLAIDGIVTRYDGQHFTRAASEQLSDRIIRALGDF